MNGMNANIVMANRDGLSSDDDVHHHMTDKRFRRRDEVLHTFKKEPEDESDIKDFAETTMNELLGWYGYDKVDSRDTQSLNLTVQRFANNGQDGGAKSSATISPPTSPHSNDNSSSSDPPNGVEDGFIACAWCQKVGPKLFTLRTPTGTKTFCSELCFNQCRRASFKKYKICDWCKHVRHTVNYVDFQDGEQQLQFCSDKCLNQYKMHIFCKEAQAHLQMHPQFQQQNMRKGGVAAVDGKLPGFGKKSHTLITPDLWLRDCKDDENAEDSMNGHLSDDSLPSNAGVSTRPNSELSRSHSDVHSLQTAEEPLHHVKEPHFHRHRLSTTSERRHRLRKVRDRERKLSRRHVLPEKSRISTGNDDACSSHLQSEAPRLANYSLIPSPFPPPPQPPPPPAAQCLPNPHPPPPPPLTTSNMKNLHQPLPQGHPEPPPRLPIPNFHGIQPPLMNAGHYPGNFMMGQPPPLNQCPPRLPFGAGHLLPPATVMVPYPVMVPVPVPIPIPIPLPIREKNWLRLMARKGLLPIIDDPSEQNSDNETDRNSVELDRASKETSENDTSSMSRIRRQTDTSVSEQPNIVHKKLNLTCDTINVVPVNESDENHDNSLCSSEDLVLSPSPKQNSQDRLTDVEDETESKRKCLRTRLSAK